MASQDSLSRAVELFRAGNAAETEAMLQRILQADPANADALHLLGLLAHHTGRDAIAADLIGKAVAINPRHPDYQINHGVALAALGRLDGAIYAYHNALALRPDSIEALSNLGDALCQKHQWDQTISICRRALALRPGIPEALCNLGAALDATGQTQEAIACFQNALVARPNYLQALNNLANSLANRRDWQSAVGYYQRALAINPSAAMIRSNFADSLARLGELDRAVAEYRQAITMRPDLAGAMHNLGHALSRMGRVTEAIACYRRASALKPDNAEMAGDLILALHYSPDFDARAIQSELTRWNQTYARPLLAASRPHDNDRQPDRRLRIGYVSSDFREHVVGWSLLPLFSSHDKDQFEIFCYSSVRRPDGLTTRLQSLCGHWQDILRLCDEQAAGQIRADAIDILVDLSLHSAGNRLLIFARKPAPIQVTYLGYAGSTGMTAIDYRLSDRYLDPESESSINTEQTFRLPNSYWCYHPGGTAPDVAPAPMLANGYVTFGCLANFAKSAAALDLWGRILRQVPDSRLILNCPIGSPRALVTEAFTKLGIAPERLQFVANQPWPRYMEIYQRIDVALDPFPYNGGITTCDSLWMGVPVISLSGSTPVSLAGRSILHNIGLPELAVSSPDEYIRVARDTQRWISLRGDLRRRMRESPLMDGRRFARDMELAYRAMWKNSLPL